MILINVIALITALAVSGVAAVFSIIGLTAIFSGAYWPIVIMGSVLEVGKVVTASWLYRFWDKTTLFVKYYLTTAVIVLMFITSMGIFGFLSKAHIEQSLLISSGKVEEITILENKISLANEEVSDYNIRINQIDSAIKDIRELHGGNPRDSLKYADQYAEERKALIDKKFTKEQEINQLKSDKLKLDGEQRKLEAEVGPIKYIANVVYGQADNNQLETAVRWVIIILVFVFDPLAIVLLIAANSGFYKMKKMQPRKKKDYVEVKRDNIMEMRNGF